MKKRILRLYYIGMSVWIICLLITWPVYPHDRYNYNPTSTITTLNTTTINNTTLNTTNIVLQSNGTMGGGSGKGRIKYTDSAIDVISVRTAYLRLQFQEDDFAIVNTTLLGRMDFYGDDDTAGADAVAGAIEVTSTGTWTDGAEDGRMELSVADDGVLNDDQLVLNTDGSVSMSGALSVGSIEATPAGLEQTYRFNMADPPTMQGNDSQWCIDPRTTAAMTITRIDITLDADPTAEMDWDLKFADAFIGLASATLIVAMDTTAGAAAITSFTDATVPANKCIYVEFGGAPDAATLQASVCVYWDYD